MPHEFGGIKRKWSNPPTTKGGIQAEKLGFGEAPAGHRWIAGADGKPPHLRRISGYDGPKVKVDPKTGKFIDAKTGQNVRKINDKTTRRERKKNAKTDLKEKYGFRINQSLDGQKIGLDFRQDIPGRVQEMITQIDKKGYVKVDSISQADVILLSKWYGKEVGVIQSPHYPKLKVKVGSTNRISIGEGEVYVVHTHPVFQSKGGHFDGYVDNTGKYIEGDLDLAEGHLEGVLDWNGKLILFNKISTEVKGKIKNDVDWQDNVLDLPDNIKVGFLNQTGDIVGYSKLDILVNPDGTTRIKVKGD